MTSDDRLAGHVEEFLAEGEHLVGVVVRTGIAGLHRDIVVSMASVKAVQNDEITLAIDAAAFAALPRASDLDGPPGDKFTTEQVRRTATRAAAQFRSTSSELATFARRRFGRSA